MTKPRRPAKPSERLGAQKPAPAPELEASVSGTDGASAADGSSSDAGETSMSIVFDRDERQDAHLMTPTRMRVATKFVVVDKTEVPIVVERELRTRFHVKLEAVYEARSILNGLATEQGNPDNRIFGHAKPDAVIGMVIESKAIADTFLTGHAFEVVFSEIV